MRKKITFAILIMIVILLITPSVVKAVDKDIIVMLDPGHGRYGTGANNGGLDEATINWKVASYVKEILDKEPGITGILTRNEVNNPSLADRALMAKENGADLLISFHINSGEGIFNRVMGAETYITGDTKQDRFNRNSKILAKELLANLRAIGMPSNKLEPILKFSTDGELYTDGMLSDYYGIIRNPMYYGIPGILIEHCYINSPQDRNFIDSDEKLRKIAQQDAVAIIKNKELFRINLNNNALKAAFKSMSYNETTKKISGEILANEVINDMSLDTMPEVVLKEVNGLNSIKAYVTKKSSYTYYYEIGIEKVNPRATYVLQAESKDKAIVPSNNTIVLNVPDQKLGDFNKMEIFVKDNKLQMKDLKYNGYMTNAEYSKISLEGSKIKGKLVVQEWLNGTKQMEPTVMPKIVIKDEAGKEVAVGSMKKVEPYVYSYEIEIGNLDKSKKYMVEVQGTNANNISDHQKVVVAFSNQDIGILGDNKVKIENGKMIYQDKNKYNGYMTNAEYGKISLEGSKIKGKLVVQEWLNGTKQMEPTVMPKIVIKDEAGKEVAVGSMKKVEPYVYSYEIEIGNLDKSKKYMVEVQGTNANNISDHQKVVVAFSNQDIGTLGEYQVKVENTNLIFKGKNNKYNGYMTNFEYSKISLEGSKIKGKLVVQEWLNGTKQIEPTSLPKIVIKDETKKEVAVGSMKKVEPYVYSYEIEIGNLDKSKKYMVEVQGTNANNISDYQKVVVAFSNQDIGTLGEYQVKVENTNLIFKGKNNKYNGYMTNFEYSKISLEGSKIKGKLVVQEWLNGTKQIEPTSLPKIVIKDETKKEVAVGSMKKVEPYVYSYEIEIGNLDKSKKYMVEVQGTNANNISDHQKVVVAFSNQNIGTLGEYLLKILSSELTFAKK